MSFTTVWLLAFAICMGNIGLRRIRAKRERDTYIKQFVCVKLSKALSGEDWGVSWSHHVAPGGYEIGWNSMANAYQKYMSSLPLQRRIEIVDRLLDIQMVKCQQEGIESADLATLVGMMNMVEVETLMCTVSDREVDWKDRQVHCYGSNDLANDVISFRFRNPH